MEVKHWTQVGDSKGDNRGNVADFMRKCNRSKFQTVSKSKTLAMCQSGWSLITRPKLRIVAKVIYCGIVADCMRKCNRSKFQMY